MHSLGHWRLEPGLHDLAFLPHIVEPASRLLVQGQQVNEIKNGWSDQDRMVVFYLPPPLFQSKWIDVRAWYECLGGCPSMARSAVCEASEDWERRCLASGDLLSFILSLKSDCSHFCFDQTATTQDYSYWTRSVPMQHLTVHIALDDQVACFQMMTRSPVFKWWLRLANISAGRRERVYQLHSGLP